MTSAVPRTSFVSAAGWGFYLACSWTWVIGMYLPVLLVREFGWAGWMAFAVPNVVGAAAMGWVLRSPEAALGLAQRHATAVRLFSLATVSFQVFALMWLLPTLVGLSGMVLVLAALLCATVLPMAAGIAQRMNAVVVWLISAAIFAMLIPSDALVFPPAAGSRPAWHLVGLVPACALGFALCPYLDATFLNARASTDRRGGRIAFTLGFGVLFLVMILFTLLYALGLDAGIFRGLGAWLLASHLAVQVCFTISAHTAVTRATGDNLAGVVVAAILALVALGTALGEVQFFETAVGELIYRGYMGFYGLFFPAYVLLVILAGGSMRLYWITTAIALPFMAAGFIAGWMPAAAGGVAVMVLGGVVAYGSRGQKSEVRGQPESDQRPLTPG